jgi:hypothetical protein
LGVLRQNEQNLTNAFTALSNDISREITRRANRDGIVPRTASVELQREVAMRVMSFFIGRNRQGERAPFELLPDGSVYPLSTYMRILWVGVTDATRIPVEQNAAMLTKRLPPDVLGSLRVARMNPFVAARSAVGEFVYENQHFHTQKEFWDGAHAYKDTADRVSTILVSEQIFRPNPLAKYEPAHTWVDPNGYRLSDRIWNTAGNTRTRLDAFLEDRIRNGQGALQMSRELETFLVPGRALRTSKPYGTDASFDAMRLSRTEIARAHAAAAEISAAMNPFVQGLRVVLSGSHRKRDICDDAAASGPWPKDEIPFRYRLPLHPACLCHYAYEMVENPQAALDAMREDIRRARSELMDFVGPVLVDQFIRLLLSSPPEVNRALPEEMPGVIFA